MKIGKTEPTDANEIENCFSFHLRRRSIFPIMPVTFESLLFIGGLPPALPTSKAFMTGNFGCKKENIVGDGREKAKPLFREFFPQKPLREVIKKKTSLRIILGPQNMFYTWCVMPSSQGTLYL